METAKFRSRARVIDLLGRQQIADVPTAMGELFKNSLDAGARNVWVNLSENEKILTIRDDGLGMRTAEVLDKWLVLATESKQRDNSAIESDSDIEWRKFSDLEQKQWLLQPSYGEKGIGRLSIATLGRMTLLWTVWGNGREKQGTLCLVHWHLFRHPGKLFEDLPIPYLSIKAAPKVSDLKLLFEELKNSAVVSNMLTDSSWNERWTPEIRKELNIDININVDLLFKSLCLEWETGTTFCIFGLSDQVDDLFLKAREDTKAVEDFPPDGLKSYHTFSTFWDPFHSDKNRRPFKIHPSLSGNALLRTSRYWEPDDFKHCDHYIRVEVSEAGYASGFIKNFGQPKIPYSFQLKSLPKGYSSPGKFLVEIGYLQGDKKFSNLPNDIYREIEKRLKHAGGFSIYLQGVRVQPYGGIDNDFAGFEERRLRNAGRYYFSSRRIFGGIFFSSKKDTPLQEKAGREGFIISGPTRGLRLWIEDLFVDIADSYLGRKAPREDKKERKREKESAAAKARIEQNKKDYIERIRLHRVWLRDFTIRVNEQVQKNRSLFASESNAVPGTHLSDCEIEFTALKQLAVELRNTPNTPPDGVVIEGDALSAVDQYLTDRSAAILKLDREILKQAKALEICAVKYRSIEDREKNILKRIVDADNSIRKGVYDLMEAALKKSQYIGHDLKEYAEKAISDIVEFRNNELDGLTAKKISLDTTGDLVQKLEKALQNQQEAFEADTVPKLKRLVDSIIHLTDETSGAIVLTEQAEELTILKERLAFLAELAQFGLILESANHEHEKQVSCIKASVELLEKELSENQLKILKTLSDSFEIIDERMRMIDPLIRRRSATQHLITGEEIEDFLKHRFQENFEEKGLVDVTENFRKASWNQVKRPVFFGAIHNIFHNALFWCRKGNSTPQIRLSSAEKLLTISDSGPGVNSRDMKRIFEPGFSRRPYGRGLGLYIAKEALKGIGYDLYYSSEPQLGALEGANFVILHQSNDSI